MRWLSAIDLSSIPGISAKVEREKQLHKVVLRPPHAYCGVHTPQMTIISKKKKEHRRNQLFPPSVMDHSAICLSAKHLGKHERDPCSQSLISSTNGQID